MNVLFTILVIALICAVVWWIISIIPLPPMGKVILQVVLGLVLLVVLIDLLMGGSTTGLRLLR